MHIDRARGWMRRGLAALPLAAAALAPMPAPAGTLTTLYSFTGGADGAVAYKGPTRDKSGNLYGVTIWGADTCPDSAFYPGIGCGTVWKLDTSNNFSVLVTFTGTNGASSDGNLTLSNGNLLGTTLTGGSGGQGTVFRVSTSGTNFKTLYSFSGPDGQGPDSFPRLDANGNIFSITEFGGPAYQSGQQNSGFGVLFELEKGSNHYISQHPFSGGAPGGAPGRVFVDGSGNIIGGAAIGGSCSGSGLPAAGCGVVYEFTPDTGVFQVLYTFTGTSDGYSPELGGFDSSGNMYGATYSGGADGYGTLFELVAGGGGYTYQHLYDFTGKHDGANPVNPAVAANGTITGTTVYGPITKNSSGAGVLYQYTTAGKLKVLNTFTNDANGGYPEGTPLVVGSTIYGVASFGGNTPCDTTGGTLISSYGCGTVYEYQK
jgi:uncharacterized repeat protein (TIGR03803 family)